MQIQINTNGTYSYLRSIIMFICESKKNKQQYTHNTHQCFHHNNSESIGEIQNDQQVKYHLYVIWYKST